MLRLVPVACFSCDTTTEFGIEDETLMECPVCQQFNRVPDGGSVAGGLCSVCKKPIDAHILDKKGNVQRCP
ncbi:MAG: hypothetical protein AB7E70_20360 [Hyphomicrobiaceae bacterium]